MAAALDRLAEIEAERERRGKTNISRWPNKRSLAPRPPSPGARHEDGGWAASGRPSNCQIGTVAEGQIVVDVAIDTTGSDRGLLRPMLERLEERYDNLPRRHLVDGGIHKNEIRMGCRRRRSDYGPTTRNKPESDPMRRGAGRSGVAAWRRRMRIPHGKGVYKRRAMGECINARFRQWGLRQFTVRGVPSQSRSLWFALANNIIAGHRLKTARA